jgi:hypothetical protein
MGVYLRTGLKSIKAKSLLNLLENKDKEFLTILKEAISIKSKSLATW